MVARRHFWQGTYPTKLARKYSAYTDWARRVLLPSGGRPGTWRSRELAMWRFPGLWRTDMWQTRMAAPIMTLPGLMHLSKCLLDLFTALHSNPTDSSRLTFLRPDLLLDKPRSCRMQCGCFVAALSTWPWLATASEVRPFTSCRLLSEDP